MVCNTPPWVVRGRVEEDALPSLSLNFTPAFRSLMKYRGMRDPSEVMDFLTPHLGQLKDPRGMKGVDAACCRIARAVETGETIGVFTDYDVDGVCSAVLLHRFFTEIGLRPPVVFFPDRTSDGYGLNRRGIDELHAQGVTLLITADCGITAHDEVAYAGSLGMDVIITDHHEPGGIPPAACAVINPKQADCPFFGEDLCGAGVIFHLLIALRAELREKGTERLPNLRGELDIVALATVADAVGLWGLNRIMVKEGLNVLNSASKVGVSALARVAGLKKGLACRDLGFVIGPRINAAGRVAHARKAFELLTTDDENDAQRIALELEALNRARQGHEQKVLAEALAFLKACPPSEHAVVAWGEGWHVGVLGIVASRLAALFSRPAVVISVAGGMGTGSGRSVPGIDLHSALDEASALLSTYGGHKMAVGLSLEEARIPEFRSALEEILSVRTRESGHILEVDLSLTPFDLTPAFLDELELLAPFGEGNPEPVFVIPSMEIVGITSYSDGQSKLVLRHSNRVYHTLRSPLVNGACRKGGILDVAFTPVKIFLNGHYYLYLSLKALAPRR